MYLKKKNLATNDAGELQIQLPREQFFIHLLTATPARLPVLKCIF